MRCPFCFAEIGEKPEVCPRCHKTLAKPDGTLRTIEEVWGSKERYHIWIPLGNLVSLLVGSLLLYLGTRGLGALGIGSGLVLLALAALSLLISRGGSRWNDLSRGQRTMGWAGVTGVIGLLAVMYAWSSLEEIPNARPADHYLRTKHSELYYPGPLPKMPSVPGEEQEKRAAQQDSQGHPHEPSA